MTEPLVASIRIEASAETVFAYLVDPGKYPEWMGREATIEPRPGGVYRVILRDGLEARGEFVEVDAPRRVVFTWGWEGDALVAPGSTRVEITLTPDERGGTLVLLQHHDVPGGEPTTMHRQGWTLYLDRLSSAVEGRPVAPDPNSGGAR